MYSEESAPPKVNTPCTFSTYGAKNIPRTAAPIVPCEARLSVTVGIESCDPLIVPVEASERVLATSDNTGHTTSEVRRTYS